MPHELIVKITSKDGYKEPVLTETSQSNGTVWLNGLKEAIKEAIKEYQSDYFGEVYFKESSE